MKNTKEQLLNAVGCIVILVGGGFLLQELMSEFITTTHIYTGLFFIVLGIWVITTNLIHLLK